MNKNLASLARRVVYFTVKNPIAARSVVNHLIKKPNDSIILPFIDYPGPIAREILSKEFGSLTVCETEDETREKFRLHVKEKFPDRRIHIHPDDLFDLSFKSHNDVAQKRCSDLVRGSLEVNNSSNETCDRHHVKFLVPLLKSRYEVGFLRNLYYQISLRIGLCANTLVHYHFLMSDRQYAYFVAKPGQNMRLYRSSTILYNTIFNIRRLESFDLETCFGINVRKIQNTAQINIPSYRKVHLVWLEPRLDVINNLNSRSLVEFRFLVTQMMHKRRMLVVSFLDKWFENFRDDIGQLGINDTTRSGDLEKDQFFKLYLYLRSREDYKKSTFLQAAAQAEESILSL